MKLKFILIKAILFIWLFLGFVNNAIAQITFTATVDAKEVVEEGVFQVKFTINNAKASNFNAPKFINGQVIAGPSQSTSMNIINGRTSQKQSFSYDILAKKKGVVNIGSATAVINGKSYKTKPINVKVVKGDPSKKKDEKISVKIELSDSIAYVGQQITLKYVLYSNVDVHNYDLIDESEYDGFFASQIKNYRDRATKIVENGVQFTRTPLKTVTLFPQQKGNFEIKGPLVNLGLPIPGQKRSNIFFSTRTKPFRTQIEDVIIKILDTPPGAPESFSGAIGKFRMNAKVDKKSITTDDAFTMTMEIRGDGDGNFIQAPNQQSNGVLEFLNPNVTKDDKVESGDQITMMKQFEYLVTANKVGNHRIRPEFSYFDTDSNKYITLFARQSVINVAKGSAAAEAKRLRKEEEIELQPIITKTSFSQPSKPFMYSLPYWGIFMLPFLGFVYVIFEKKKKDKLAGIDPKLKKQAAAKAEALKRLTSAKAKLDVNEARGFYDELYKGMNTFLNDKFMIPASELTKEKISKHLANTSLEAEKKDRILAILEKCQMGLFSGGSTSAIAETYDEAVDLISEIDA